MVTIIHGDDFVSSRNELVKLMSTARSESEVIAFTPQQLTYESLSIALMSPALFAAHKTVVIENLFDLKSDKLRKDLLSLIVQATQYVNIILWDSKTLTKTQLGLFKTKIQAQLFTLPKLLFKFLDSLLTASKENTLLLLSDLLKSQSSEFILLMIVRQIRLLILAKNDTLNLPPWMLAKLKFQAAKVTEKNLLDIYKELLLLDKRMKTSKNLLPLTAELDLLILKN